MDKYLVLDVETHGTDPRKGARFLCGAWATETHEASVTTELPDEVYQRLADPECIVISHSTYDPVWMKRIEAEVTGPFHDTMVMAHLLNENTKLSLEACAEIYLGLTMDKRLERSDKKLWFRTDSGEKMELHVAWEKVPDQVMFYCFRDTEATVKLYLNLMDRMQHTGWWPEFVQEHAPFTEVLIDMQCNGIPINLGEAAALKDKLTADAIVQKQTLLDSLGYEINFASPPQLKAVLFSKVFPQAQKMEITPAQRDCLRGRCNHEGDNDQHDNQSNHAENKQGISELHYEPPSNFEVTKVGTKYVYGTVMQKGLGLTPKVKTDKGSWSTSTPTLTTYHGGHPIVKDLIAYRKTEKVIGTYLNTYPEYSYEDRLYGRFNQTGTATGRLSHSNPNLGNQPTRGELGHAIRGLFQGRFIIGDHGQLENRFMAHFSGDPVLLDVYRENKDIHIVTAEYVFGKKVGKDDVERDIAKTFGYAMGYGAAATKLAQIMALNGFWTPLDRVEEYLRELESLYSVFFDWKKHVQAEAKQKGYVTTIGGRVRRLRYAYEDRHFRVRNKADRQAVNSIIQGSAADILRRNMLHVRKQYEWLPLLNQVHDELIWEYPEELIKQPDRAKQTLVDLQYICEHPGYDLSVPLKFEPSYCASWADKGGGLELPPEEDEDEDD